MPYRQLKTPNIDPVIYVGNTWLTSWAGWCLAYVEVAFGTPRKYASAWEAWSDTQKRHEDRNFPVGVYFPIWFEHYGSYGSPLRYGNWGHVAIAKISDSGSMVIWSSPASAKAEPDVYSSIAQIERIYSSRYVGWSEDIARTDVIEGGNQEVTVFVRPFKNHFIKSRFKKPIKMYNMDTNQELWDSGNEAEFVAKTNIVHGSTFYVTRDRWESGEPYGFKEEHIYAKGNDVKDIPIASNDSEAQTKLDQIKKIIG